MEDNFYQASSERLIAIPKSLSDKMRKEKFAYEHERPLITKVMEQLEASITARERIDFITETNDPENFMREVAVNKQVCSVLRRELHLIQSKVKSFDEEVKKKRHK